MNKLLKTQEPRRGQVMLLTILFLSAAFLSATVVAGYIMVQELGQVSKVADSAKAIFAADTGIERALFLIFRCNNEDLELSKRGDETVCDNAALDSVPDIDGEAPKFYNNASYQLLVSTSKECSLPHDKGADQTTVTCIRSTGRAGRVARAFGITFSD